MKCTRCGYTRQKNDDHFFPANECPSCGIIYNKNKDHFSDDLSIGTDGSEPVLRPSPVDAESLKKARERVEKRLKERLAAQKRDSRHDQTLELARQLASEGVRERQAQWEKQQTALQESDDSQTDPSTESPTTEEDSKGEPVASEYMTESSDANASTAEVMAQHDSDTTPPASDHSESILAKAMEKRKKTTHSDDTQGDATNADDDASEILDMESESEDTVQKSCFVSSREATDAALSAAAPDSGEVLDDQPQTNDALTESGRGHQRERWRWVPGGGLARLLPLVAWLILLAGICGAVLSWTTLTEAEAGMQTQHMGISNSMNLGLLLGFAYLVTGVLGFAFFWVSSLISNQLKDIRRLLLLQPIHQSESTAAQPVPAPEETQ
jgi:hypothetical protein